MNTNWNHLKEVADNIGTGLDGEQAWDRFEKRRSSKKRRFIFWWPYGGLAFALLIGIITFYVRGNQANHTTPATDYFDVEKVNLNNANTRANMTLDGNSSFKQDQTVFNKNQNQPDSDRKSIPIQDSGDINSSHSNTHAAGVKSIKKQSNNSKNNNIKESGETITHDSNLGKVNDQLQFHSHASQQLNSNLDIEQGVHEIKQNFKAGTSTDTALPKDVNSNDNITSNSQLNGVEPVSIIENLETAKEVLVFQNIPLLLHLINKQEPLPIESYVQVAELPAKQHKFSAHELTVQARYIYGFVNRKINGDLTPFTERRNNQEDFLESNAIELLLSKKIAPHLSISSGISLNQYRSKLFEVNQELIQNITYSDVLLELRIKDGITQEFRGEYVGSQTIITERVRIQKYIDMSIPVYVQFEINPFSSLAFSISTGLNFSLMNLTKGITFDSPESQGSYQSLDNLNYRKFGVIQGLINVGASVDIGKRFEIYLGGQLRQDLNHRIKYENDSSEVLKGIGLSLGLHKTF